MRSKLSALCSSSDVPTRDALTGAGVMLGATLLFTVLGIAASRQGHELAGEALKAAAFPGSVVLALPFLSLREKPRRFQLLFVGLLLLAVMLIGAAAGFASRL